MEYITLSGSDSESCWCCLTEWTIPMLMLFLFLVFGVRFPATWAQCSANRTQILTVELCPDPYVVMHDDYLTLFTIDCQYSGEEETSQIFTYYQVNKSTDQRAYFAKRDVASDLWELGGIENITDRAELVKTADASFTVRFFRPELNDVLSAYECAISYKSLQHTISIQLTPIPDPRPVELRVSKVFTKWDTFNVTCRATVQSSWSPSKGTIRLESQVGKEAEWNSLLNDNESMIPILPSSNDSTLSSFNEVYTSTVAVIYDAEAISLSLDNVTNCIRVRCHVRHALKNFTEYAKTKVLMCKSPKILEEEEDTAYLINSVYFPLVPLFVAGGVFLLGVVVSLCFCRRHVTPRYLQQLRRYSQQMAQMPEIPARFLLQPQQPAARGLLRPPQMLQTPAKEILPAAPMFTEPGQSGVDFSSEQSTSQRSDVRPIYDDDEVESSVTDNTVYSSEGGSGVNSFPSSRSSSFIFVSNYPNEVVL